MRTHPVTPFNFMTHTDSYKVSHPPQLPPDVLYTHFHICARKAMVVPFGFQAQLLKYFVGEQITHAKMNQAERKGGRRSGVGTAGACRCGSKPCLKERRSKPARRCSPSSTLNH
jgi:hypothetical protein